MNNVHVSAWPEFQEEWIQKSEIKDWEDLLALRDLVNSKIEEKRAKGEIGSSLAASISLAVKPGRLADLIDKYQTDLRTIFIVSEVKISVSTGGDEVQIEVHPAPGTKCERCWNYSVQVGHFADHPTLCERCVEVVRKLS